MVLSASREALLAEIRAAGFEEVERVDVGADPTVVFAVARRPALDPDRA